MSPECSLKALGFATETAGLSGPYALRHYLPAGLLFLTLQPHITTCHTHTHNLWHHYTGWRIFSGALQPDDEPLVRLLDFLILHKFIAATCKITSYNHLSIMTLRVYIIPFDLSNVEGQLRRRDEATVLNPARKYLRTLLSKLSTDASAWEGESFVPGSKGERILLAEDTVCSLPLAVTLSFSIYFQDNRTLAQIYNTLPSPSVREDDPALLPLARDILCGADIPGMVTSLHKYQRRSVAAMVQRELQPGSMLDPLYVPIHGMDGTTFYLQPATMEILRDCPLVFQGRGGILCEELGLLFHVLAHSHPNTISIIGTGKTVMTLALISATMDQLPAPEESIVDPRPVMTPLSFRHFPSETFTEARNRFFERNKRKKLWEENGPRIPSLVELAFDVCRLNPGGAGMRESEDILREHHLSSAYKRNSPFYFHYEDVPLEENRSSRKSRGGKGPKMMYLTSGTLVVVPANLMNQWANEMNKHCDHTLQRYVVTDGPLPAAQQLVLYDVRPSCRSSFLY